MDSQLLIKNQTVGGTDIHTSEAVLADSRQYFGVWVKATSVVGTPALRIYFEQSFDREEANFSIPDAMPDVISALGDENIHILSILPVPLPYLRFKVAGLAANPADTVVNLYLFAQ
jgi:hypothetical protein